MPIHQVVNANKNGQLKPCAAFSLLELIVVILVLGIVSTYVFTRFSASDDYLLDTVVEQLISAGHLTQQLSMNDNSRSFTLSIQSNQIDLLVDGNSFSTTGVEFPLIFNSKVNLSPTTNINFNNLGETNSTVINIQISSSSSVCFESSGMIQRC